MIENIGSNQYIHLDKQFEDAATLCRKMKADHHENIFELRIENALK